MAQAATRYLGAELSSINFLQAKLALEQHLLKDHAGPDTNGSGGAIPAEEHNSSSFATKQSTAVLNTDCCIPLIGLGSFKADEKTTHEALASALKAGCRHIDCASHYLNGSASGSGLHAALKAGHAKGEDLFITSKGWYVGEEDMDFFKERLGQPAGSGPWEHIMAKDFGTLTYEAWRRTLADGKTEYKSITVAEDSTAEEFMDFYLDDHTRAQWDPMISEHESLEVGDGRQRCQVVRWVRTFPFSFLSKREYIIGRRMWRGPDGCLFGITKSIDHPRAPPARGIVRMDVFWSMWRSRTIPCPHGSGRPACETVLIHHEQFKIPENLARFAVRHGMNGVVKKMGLAFCEFVADRRKRVRSFEDDPEAYGASGTPNPPSRSAPVASWHCRH